jgi:hypothetical protein
MSLILEEIENEYRDLERLFDRADRVLVTFHINLFKELIRLQTLPSEQLTRDEKTYASVRKPVADLIYDIFNAINIDIADRFAKGIYDRYHKAENQIINELELSNQIMNNLKLRELLEYYRDLKNTDIYTANIRYRDWLNRVKVRKVIP